MAKKRQKAYFGMSWLLSIIFAIIPITNLIFGIVIRVQRGNILGLILNIILAPLFYIVDLVTIIFTKDLKFLA